MSTIEQVEVAAMMPQTPDQKNMIDVASSRAAQEVQAAMVVAKKFPRDTVVAEKRILDACKRIRLAESALYSYPRGGSKVEGESIRLAEVYLQCWGNVEAGVVELARANGESTAMAYCMDLETNARDVKVFTVKHIRDRSERKGGNVQLTDERDIYELVANMGARRKRACILSVIPIDIRESAIEQCRKTLEGDQSVPLIDRVKSMAAAFEPLGVSVEMLQQRLGHNLSATTAHELVTLRGIFASLKDGMSNIGDWFEVAGREPVAKGNAAVLDKLQGKANGAAKSPEPLADNPPAESVKEQAEQVWGDKAPDPTSPPTAPTPAPTGTGTQEIPAPAASEPEQDPLDAMPISQPPAAAEQPPAESHWKCNTPGCGAEFMTPETKKVKGNVLESCPKCHMRDITPVPGPAPIRMQWVCTQNKGHVFLEQPKDDKCPTCFARVTSVRIPF